MPIQTTHVRSYHEPPMAKYKGIKADLKKIPKAKSSNRWYHDREKRKVLYVLCGSLACVILVGAIFAIPIVLTTLLTKTTTSTSTEGTLSTTTVLSNTTIANITASTNVFNTTGITSVGVTTNATTTYICPNMTCTFSPIVTLMQSNYGVEQLNMNCTQSLSYMFIEIHVQRTVNASYANQYQTFWNLTTNQTYIETISEIIYTWTLLPGQIIQDIGFPYFVEGQYNLAGINQTTNFDTYSATFTSVCGHNISETGTF